MKMQKDRRSWITTQIVSRKMMMKGMKMKTKTKTEWIMMGAAVTWMKTRAHFQDQNSATHRTYPAARCHPVYEAIIKQIMINTERSTDRLAKIGLPQSL